jgi:hypothetical protein
VGAHSGPKVKSDGLVFSFDPGNTKSSLLKKQSSNILPDPNNWTTGTGGVSGYGANGATTEQNRLYVDDDPWGRRSVTWRTTPDATSDADGGWNTSYYSIDRAYTYRWSVWVRRYTTGTGGTFYFGLNPAPLRNDNGAVQSNPYFTTPAISSLTYNQWYLVVGHCFYQGYSGGRHSDSGWYENGVKISDKSYGNVGSADVRWDVSTTTAMHRAYHYYTTNTASGIEFAYPRLDKCDGTQPTIKELIKIGESGGKGLVRGKKLDLYNGVSFSTERKNVGYYIFDGANDGIKIDETSDLSVNQMTISSWNYSANYNHNGFMFEKTTNGSVNTQYSLFFNGNNTIYYRTYGLSTTDLTLSSATTYAINNKWNHIVATFDGTNKRIYVNGVLRATSANLTGTVTQNSTGPAFVGAYGNFGGYFFNGRIAQTRVYNRALSSDEIKQNFNAQRGRFGI